MTKRGVDHGIGGRDNVKSKQRRAKKAEKTKKIALAALQGGRKREVIFNEAARQEWLTGFSKRKQERRKFGLTMQVEKDKKKHKDEVKTKRQVIRETTLKDGEILDVIVEEMKQGELLHTENIDKELIFQDEQTKEMFGDTVTVVVDRSGLADELESQAFPAEQHQQQQQAITKLHNKQNGGGGGRTNNMKPQPKKDGKSVKKSSKPRLPSKCIR
jgi:Nucleolar protein 12 (25kDa)